MFPQQKEEAIAHYDALAAMINGPGFKLLCNYLQEQESQLLGQLLSGNLQQHQQSLVIGSLKLVKAVKDWAPEKAKSLRDSLERKAYDSL